METCLLEYVLVQVQEKELSSPIILKPGRRSENNQFDYLLVKLIEKLILPANILLLSHAKCIDNVWNDVVL